MRCMSEMFLFLERKTMENLYTPKTHMYTGCTSDLCETPEIHVNILIDEHRY